MDLKSLPKGPFRSLEFTAPEKRTPDQRGKIAIHGLAKDPVIEIEPESLYYYFLIQIVAELQNTYPEDFKEGVSTDVVLHYLLQMNDRLRRLPKRIRKAGSLESAWRKYIRKGTQYRFYLKQNKIRHEMEVAFDAVAPFMEDQLFPPQKLNFPFKINVINPQGLYIRSKVLSDLVPHIQATQRKPEPPSILDKYINAFSNDFRIRNILFIDRYRDMTAYVERILAHRPDKPSDLAGTCGSDLSTTLNDYRRLLQNRRTIIQGEPGSGKTALLHHLALNLATNFKVDRFIPLYVELPGYNGAQTLYHYAIKEAARRANVTGEGRLEFHNAIRDNKANLVFLLDGYDEVRNNPKLVEEIRSLPSTSRTIITARKCVLTASVAADVCYELESFNMSGRRSFVEQAARVFGMQEDAKDRVLMDIGASFSISNIVQNPLILLCICWVANCGGDVPLQRIQIFRQAKETLVDLFVKKQSPDLSETIEYLRNVQHDGVNIFDAIFGKLAFHHFSKSEFEFSKPSIINFIEEAVREYEKPEYRFQITNAVLNCGLIVRGSLDGKYSFLHPMFMEYFAALWLSNTSEWKEPVLRKYLDPSWRNVILLFIAQCGISRFQDIYELLTHCDDYFHNGLLLAAESVEEFTEYPAQTQEIIEKILGIARKHPLYDDLIGSLYSNKTQMPFMDPFTPLRTDLHFGRLVIESLVKRGDKPHLDRCIDVIFSPILGNPTDKFTEFVSYYGKEIGLKTLRDTLLQQVDDRARCLCASALALIGSDLAEATLIECLIKEKESGTLRTFCISALGYIGSTRCVEECVRILKNDKDERLVRKQCAKTLGYLSPPDAANGLVIVLSRSGDDIEVRKACAVALGNIGAKKAIGPLMRFLRDEPDAGLRIQCAKALGEIRSEKPVDKIAYILGKTKERPDVRCACARALGEIRSGKCWPTLANIVIQGSDPQLQEECVRALVCIDRIHAKGILVEVLDNPAADGGLRGTCASLLSQIGSPRVDTLRTFLRNPACDKRLCESCVIELGRLGSIKALPELSYLLSHADNFHVRELCAKALGEIRSDESIEILEEEVLTGNNPTVRHSCIRAIGMISSPRAALALKSLVIEMARGNERELVCGALEALAGIPTETSLEFCVEKLKEAMGRMKEEIPNPLKHKFGIKYGSSWFLQRIRTLSCQLNRIVSPESLGLSDVLKE